MRPDSGVFYGLWNTINRSNFVELLVAQLISIGWHNYISTWPDKEAQRGDVTQQKLCGQVKSTLCVGLRILPEGEASTTTIISTYHRDKTDLKSFDRDSQVSQSRHAQQVLLWRSVIWTTVLSCRTSQLLWGMPILLETVPEQKNHPVSRLGLVLRKSCPLATGHGPQQSHVHELAQLPHQVVAGFGRLHKAS